MGEMVRAKGCGIGDADWEIGEYGEDSVVEWRTEGEVVTYFMDCKEEVLIACCAHNIGRQKES